MANKSKNNVLCSIELGKLISVIGKLNDLYGYHPDIRVRWDNRIISKYLTSIIDDYNKELDKIRNVRQEGLDKIENEKDNSDYSFKVSKINISADDDLIKLNSRIIDIPNWIKLLSIEQIEKTIEKKSIDISSYDFSIIEPFIKE